MHPRWLPLLVFPIVLMLVQSGSAGSGPEESTGRASPERLLPVSDRVPGWKLSSGVSTYDAGRLWEYLDGAADAYLAYDFRSLSVAEYSDGDSAAASVVIEAYEMKDPLSAFGIYSSERPRKSNFLRIGGEGYLEDSFLVFWKGVYYFKLSYFSESGAGRNPLADFAKEIEGGVGGDSKEPGFFQVFPDSGQVPHTRRYVARDFMGHGFLKRVFLADYVLDGAKGAIFAARCDSLEEAEDGLARYERFTKKTGRVPGAHPLGIGDVGFTGTDRRGRPVSLFRRGSFLFGTIGLGMSPSVVRNLRELAASLEASGQGCRERM